MHTQTSRWFVAVLLLAGCESSQVADMRGQEVAPWDTLATFRGEPLMSVGYPLEMGDMGALKAALTSEKFKGELTAFEQSELPSGHADKQDKKAAMVQAWKDAIAAAEAGNNEEMKTKTQAAMDATNAL